jgi:hypothetical protein
MEGSFLQLQLKAPTLFEQLAFVNNNPIEVMTVISTIQTGKPKQ